MSRDTSERVTRRRFVQAAAGAGVVGAAGCTSEDSGGENEGLSGEIAIAGSSTVFPVASAVAEEFQSMHENVDISVQSTGSGGGFSNFFCVGETDFNNASRPIAAEEEELCAENDVAFHEISVATDAVTVVVNPDAEFAEEATFDELAQIWGPEAESGQQWSDVRSEWPDEEIERFGPAETSGTFDFFTETVVGEEGAHTQDYQATEDDNTIVQGVSGSEFAIGYFGFAFFQGNSDAVKALSVDGGSGAVEPTLDTAKNGDYPLSRPLFTYPAASAMQEEHKAEFARFFTEQSANQELIADDIGYVPNTESAMETELEELNAFIEEAQS